LSEESREKKMESDRAGSRQQKTRADRAGSRQQKTRADRAMAYLGHTEEVGGVVEVLDR
jgi:hypothetical protein